MKPFIECLKTLHSLTHVAFSAFRDMRQNTFHIIKPHIVKLAFVAINVIGNPYTRLIAKDFKGFREVHYTYSRLSYMYRNVAYDGIDLNAYGKYKSTIRAIQALDNVVLRYVPDLDEDENEESEVDSDSDSDDSDHDDGEDHTRCRCCGELMTENDVQ